MTGAMRNALSVVLDTNIWISFLMGGRLSGLHLHIYSGRVKVVTCALQIEEMAKVLARPRIRRYIPCEQADEFLDLLCERAVFVEPKSGPGLCRDPKDDYLLYTAITADADILVTGDSDLLVLGQVGKTRIMSYSDFDKVMEA